MLQLEHGCPAAAHIGADGDRVDEIRLSKEGVFTVTAAQQQGLLQLGGQQPWQEAFWSAPGTNCMPYDLGLNIVLPVICMRDTG